MIENDHDNLYWSIIDQYPKEALEQDCLDDSRFYDRLGEEICFGHWRCLINHKEYYCIESIHIEDYIIEVLWIGKDMSINKELRIFSVPVQNKTTKITKIHPKQSLIFLVRNKSWYILQ